MSLSAMCGEMVCVLALPLCVLALLLRALRLLFDLDAAVGGCSGEIFWFDVFFGAVGAASTFVEPLLLLARLDRDEVGGDVSSSERSCSLLALPDILDDDRDDDPPAAATCALFAGGVSSVRTFFAGVCLTSTQS
jgi:hypothetical protein